MAKNNTEEEEEGEEKEEEKGTRDDEAPKVKKGWATRPRLLGQFNCFNRFNRFKQYGIPIPRNRKRFLLIIDTHTHSLSRIIPLSSHLPGSTIPVSSESSTGGRSCL